VPVSGGNSPGSIFQEFEPVIDTTAFTVTAYTVVAAKTKVYVGGILLPQANYTVSGQVITTTAAVPAYSLVTISN
jgi:hypothetical protein